MEPTHRPPGHHPETRPRGPDWHAAREFLLDKLAQELPSTLFYHGVHHTRDDVLPAADRLAALARLDSESHLLLRTAALYHDAGYLYQYHDNEAIAVRVASATLPSFHYTPDQISTIAHLIMATRMPHVPDGRLAALLCDADLDSLGREDYLETSLALWHEHVANGKPVALGTWYRRQIDFLAAHVYFTPEAQSLRGRGKQENLQLLRNLIAVLEPRDG